MSRFGRTVLAGLLAAAGVTVPATAAMADGPACQVGYEAYPYTGGFTANITIRNSGTVGIYGWTFEFPLDDTATVVEFANARLVSGHGTITSRDVGWNANVPSQTQIGIFFRADGTSAAPAVFKVNGLTCGRLAVV